MIAKIIKAYFEERKERKRISEQYALEKKCVEYFDKSVPRWTGSLEELIGSTPLPEKEIYLLGKFKKDSFPLQAVRLHRSWWNERLTLSYGDYSYNSTYEWITSVENFPNELWFSTEDYPRPTRPTLLLCEYNSGHYEVVEYTDKTWVTELCFPVKPTRYFVLDFLAENK